jgi:hypothetical protein
MEERLTLNETLGQRFESARRLSTISPNRYGSFVSSAGRSGRHSDLGSYIPPSRLFFQPQVRRPLHTP